MKLGIDFGTTNSAVAVLGADGTPRILELEPGARVQRTVIHGSHDGIVRFGNAGFRAYQEQDLTGRMLRSLKAFLAQDVPSTTLGRQRYSFTELISHYLRFLVRGAERVLGAPVTSVVVGRPVHFHADPDRDALAARRLQEALSMAGLPPGVMQLEPVAAAHRYEQGLSRERIVLVGDFGGGTSDFAILRVGPGRGSGDERLKDVLATAGVAQAGDVLDGRFLDTFLMPWFGRGATVKRRYLDERAAWSHPIQVQIQRLYYLHLLREPDLRTRLESVLPRMSDPNVVRRLLELVFDDLGYPMAWAIERTKQALAGQLETSFRFGEFASPSLAIEQTVTLDAFADGCASQLAAYGSAVDAALADAGLQTMDVDDVFLTGGTSQLPFIRALFAERFGAERLHGGDAFTTVCEGLALR